MGFKRAIEFSDTGATLEHHRVCAVALDMDAVHVIVSVKSYVNKEKMLAGRNHVGYTQWVIPGLPASGEDVFDWAEQKAITDEKSPFLGAVAE